MGVEHGNGTDSRTENSDKPASSERPYTPPPDNPGSPGQPSRLESRARARETQQDTGDPPGGERHDKPQTTNGQPRESGKDRDSGTSEAGTESGRTEQPATSQWPQRDMPGQPGQPSRLESLARAREAQQHPAHDRQTNSGTEPTTDREDRPATSPNGEAAGQPETLGQSNDQGEPQKDDDTSHDSRTTTGLPDHEAPSARTTETDRPQDRLPRQDTPDPAATEQDTPDADNPLGDSGETRPEQTGQATDQTSPGQPETHPDTTPGDPRPGDHTTEPTRDAEHTPQAPDGTTDNTPAPPDNRTGEQETAPEDQTTDQPTGPQEPRADSDGPGDAPQRKLGEELAELTDNKINTEIDSILDKVNPKFDCARSAYSENCTGVVQANELQRRGSDVEAGPLERSLRTDEGGQGGRPLTVIERAWGDNFVPGSKADIEDAFKEPGSRGIVYIGWNRGGAHVFNVENVGGNVRFVDGQPTPSVPDASHYFALGTNTHYLRLDNLPTPPKRAVARFLEP
ncbi:toxin glutamine deamidase domain-containing protein [Actinomadura spongiicola]|uniref:toxin glutamine deamidase domain-containing protein n=1 Tax=Actinomadura spongiicola TaxID=2303421 RepID=UPI0013148DC9|nr:toxin glutamine deamidase domain-containing protein [Actinomadura spongiicola]